VFLILALNVKKLLSEEVETIIATETVRTETVDIKSFIKMPKFVFLCLALSIASMSFSIFDPVLATRLAEFNVGPNFIGFFFCIGACVYFLMALTVGTYAKRYNQIVFVTAGLTLLPFAYWLIGPSLFLHFPNKLFLIPFGQIFLGTGGALILIPMIPAFLSCTKDKVPQTEESIAELKDKISGIWNSMGGFGSILGPILGGSLVTLTGYRTMCDLMALFVIVFGVLFFKFTDGFTVFKELFSKKQVKERQLLVKELGVTFEKKNSEEQLMSSNTYK